MRAFALFASAVSALAWALYVVAHKGHQAGYWMMPSFAFEILSALSLLILVLTRYAQVALEKQREWLAHIYLGGIVVKILATVGMLTAFAYIDKNSATENLLLGLSTYMLETLFAVVFLRKIASKESRLAQKLPKDV